MSEDGPRAPRPDELDELIAHVGHVMRGEVGAAPTYAQGLPRIYCLDNLQNIRVMRVDGRIVSSAAISPHTTRAGDVRLRIGRITGVTTDSAYRRRGYATRVMHACGERMAELGCELSLLGSGVPSWYRKLGWERGGVERIYRFDRGNRHLLTSGSSLEMRPAEDADFETLAAIHAARTLGGVRSPELLRSMWSPGPGAAVWVALRDRQVGAYLRVRGTVGHRIRRPGGPGAAHAGSPAGKLGRPGGLDLDSLDRGTAGKHQADGARNPGCAVAAGRCDGGAGLAGHSAVRQLRADDSDRGPQGLVRAYGRTDLTAYADGDSIVVETPDRTLRLSRTDAVKLFFGPERPVSPDVAGLPFVFHAWSADRV